MTRKFLNEVEGMVANSYYLSDSRRRPSGSRVTPFDGFHDVDGFGTHVLHSIVARFALSGFNASPPDRLSKRMHAATHAHRLMHIE